MNSNATSQLLESRVSGLGRANWDEVGPGHEAANAARIISRAIARLLRPHAADKDDTNARNIHGAWDPSG